jgi:hypothetical protein
MQSWSNTGHQPSTIEANGGLPGKENAMETTGKRNNQLDEARAKTTQEAPHKGPGARSTMGSRKSTKQETKEMS